MSFTLPPHLNDSPRLPKKDQQQTTPPLPRKPLPVRVVTETPPGVPANPPEVRPVTRVQASYKQLAHAAIGLNSASDELGKAIAVVDAALKKLNLGISAWATLSRADGAKLGQGWWWSRDLGYAKIRERWGVALRTRSGDSNGDGDSEEIWLFNDAPRWLRTEAVGKIPDLLEALLKQAEETTKLIEKKTAQAVELAGAIDEIAADTQMTEGW